MVKSLLIRLLATLGLPSLFRRLNRGSLTILLYHGVAPKADYGIYNYRGKFISPEVFSMELSYLKNHYTILDLDEAVEKLRSGTLPPNSLAITFDDGYKNFYEYAFPLLKQHGLSATFFLPTDFVLNKVPLWVDRLEYLAFSNDAEIRQQLKTLPDEERNRELEKLESASHRKLVDFSQDAYVYSPLSIEEIKEMQSAGMKFGVHTKSHPILSKVSGEKLADEIGGAKKLLEENFSNLSKIFCYPNGQLTDFNEETIAVARNAGFVDAVTTISGLNKKNTPAFYLNRIVMDNIADEKTFAFKLSNLF